MGIHMHKAWYVLLPCVFDRKTDAGNLQFGVGYSIFENRRAS